jgi:hypothetical protein
MSVESRLQWAFPVSKPEAAHRQNGNPCCRQLFGGNVKRAIRLLPAMLLVCLLVFAFSSAAAQAPKITSISPTSGVPGTQVTVIGTNFGATQGSGSVVLGTKSGVVVSWSNTQIVATVASGAGAGEVLVTQTGISNGIWFSMAPPAISSVNPTTGAPGTQVTVAGSGFGVTQGSGAVNLAASPGTIVSWSDTQIVGKVVPGPGWGSVSATQNGVTGNGIPFYVLPANITSVSPTSGVPGTQVTITGSGFGATQGSSFATLGSNVGVINSWSDTQIIATVASGAGPGYVVITQSGINSNSFPFSIIPATVTSVSPSSGGGGTQVTVTGSGFGATQGSGQIQLGSLNATVNSWSDGQIIATVATGSAAGYAKVFQNGVWSNGLPFTSTPPTANITAISPTSGIPGTQVTITGTGFGTTQGSSTVQLGNKLANVVSWGDTQVVATVAAGALSGVATVTTGGHSSNQIPFAMNPAIISTVTPIILTIGAQVTITGSGFGAAQGSGSVPVGSAATPATIVSWSDTQIVATVTAGTTAPGLLRVSQNGVLSNMIPITMTPPTITSATPTTLSTGTQITISGSGFGATKGNGGLFLGSQATQPTIVSWSDTQVVATVVAGTLPGSVWLKQNGVNSNSFPITIAAPIISGVNPPNAPASTQVTITGSGFGASQGTGSVVLSATVQTVVSWSDTQIVAVVPSTTSQTGSAWVRQYTVFSNSVPFTITALNISGISPTNGTPGTQVTISGTGFGTSQGSSKVWIGTAYASVVSWSNTQIVAAVAAGAGSGPVQVYLAGNLGGTWSNAINFIVNPNISGLSPTSGPVGASVTITGTNFGATQGSSTVTFNGTAAAITSWSTGSIVATVPTSATTGNVVVTVSGIASNGMSFTVLPTPSITGLSPTANAVGTLVTITGANFGATQGTSTVTFNGTAATAIASWSAGSIVARVPSGATTGNIVVAVTGVASNGMSFTVLPGNFVATTGAMGFARQGHTATQLLNGKVLIAGGKSSSGILGSAELYTPTAQTFANANAMIVPRWLHTATLLDDGTVLIVGGSSLTNRTALNTAEIYDPVAGSSTLLLSTLNTARAGHTATLLSNGQVLIAGGYNPTTGIISDAELYDPTAQVFIDLGNTNSPRFAHTATLLQNGQVLIAGGQTDPTPTGAYNTAEVFDPTTWLFTPLSAIMTSVREGHTATLLNNGQVLISGGDVPGTGSLNTAEIYNPAANTFTAVTARMTAPRIFHSATLLNGGTVLITGGATDASNSSAPLSNAEIFYPTSQTFTAVPTTMTSVREQQTVTLLNDGTMLESGGTDGTNIFNTAELYVTSRLTGLTSVAISPATPSVPLGTQQLLVATGTFSNGSTQVLSSALWSSSSASVLTMSNDATDTGFATSVGLGNATVTATAVGISGSTTITVPAPTLTSITLSPLSPTLPMGTSQQFTATGVYSDGSFRDLTSTATWTSSASAATVSSAGLVAGVSQGTSTIQASSGSQSASTTVTVGAPVLVALALTPSTATIALGTTQQYQVVGTYTDGSTQNLTSAVNWSSVPQNVAPISAAGLASSTGQGTATITARSGRLNSVATLHVTSANLVSITLVPSATSIPVNSQQQFEATGHYSDGSNQDITTTVTWSASGTGIASVSATGVASALAGGTSTITATVGAVTGTAALMVDTGTISLHTSRYQHSATLLNSGAVLIAGGISCPSSGSCTYLNSAEVYDPSVGTVAITGNMATARSAPAVLLGNGKVFIAGGYSCDSSGNCASLGSAEIYDPAAGTFSSAGNMTANRDSHTMTLLSSGQVLIAAGETCSSATSCTALSTAEIYDPVAHTFTATGSLHAARFNASAVALSSGQVLIAGGFNGTSYAARGELYDPIAGTFSNTATNLNTPRANATATLLNNSRVLIAGGSTCNSPGCPTSVAELYNGGSFSSTNNMSVARWDQTATLLTNGQVLLAGGYDSCASSCLSDTTTELFNPQGNTLTTSQSLTTSRSGHTATLLTDGGVLLVGGINNGATLSSVDSYQPTSLGLPQLASITIAPPNEPMVLGTTLPLVATGTDSSGNRLGTLQSVIWNSSSPSVATISNAAGSAGIVNSVSVGTTTITASVGTVSATTQVTVTAPLVSIALSPSSPSITLNSLQELQLTATGTYSDGSSRNLTPDVTWSTSNSSVATVIANPAIQGIVAPLSAGTANITARFGSITGSTPVTVVAPVTPTPPSVASVVPTSGAAGTQVTLTGSGFGASQGSGIVLLGSTLGTVVSWSNTQVVATVNTGSTSGVAQIQQAGLSSNSVTFTVNTAAITNVSPASGLPGTQVTITGSGFGASQGSGMVWLGTAPAVVTNWSDGQVTATVAAGSTSGNAQVLQNGVWSNAVSFTIDTLRITGITPTSGSAGTVVTVTGGGFGSSQGSGSVLIGGATASVVGWSNNQVVASVASNAVTGVVRVEQNGAWSNAVTFTVPPSLSGGTAVTVVPNFISMVVGDTRSIQALNASGQEVTGLSWTSSDTTVATLSTADPPTITAVAAGHVTISAGSASASLDVFAGPTLPVGTKIWSAPGDGSGVTSIVPAVPSSTGVADVFALQGSGSVQAIKSDGTVAWTAPSVGGPGVNSTLLPDFQGGLVVVDFTNILQPTVRKLDGVTGQPYPTYAYANFNRLLNPNNPGVPPVLVHTDGTIFTVDDNAIVAINPTTGNVKFSVALAQGSTNTYNGGNCGEFTPQTNVGPSPAAVGQGIIAGDGYVYFPHSWTNSAGVSGVCDSNGNPVSWGSNDTHLRILRVGTDGSSLEATIGDWSQSCVSGNCVPSGGGGPAGFGTLITNADQGILYSWGLSAGDSTQNQLTTIAADGSASTVVTSMGSQAGVPVQPVLQRADGTYIGSVAGSMVAFTQAGQQLWSQTGFTPQIATSDGGVIATSSGQTVTFDANGNQTGQLASLPTYSWKGSYELGSVDSFITPDLTLESSFAAVFGGSLTHGGTHIKQRTIGLFWCGNGPSFSGSCSSFAPLPQNSQTVNLGPAGGQNMVDLGFVYQPWQDVGKANAKTLPFDFTVKRSDWVDLIEANALAALKAAFTNVAVLVKVGSTHLQNARAVLDQDNVIFVVGNPGDLGFDVGDTPPIIAPNRSYVLYQNVMLNGQLLLFGTNYLPCPGQTQSQQSRCNNLIPAIGKAIGNTAAHELGHQFRLRDMHFCVPTPNLTNSCQGDFYEADGLFDGEFKFIGSPFQWTPRDKTTLDEVLGSAH